MDDQLTVFINALSYLGGAWIAFKIFDHKKKGQKRSPKDDRLLWPLLLFFALGLGTLVAYILRSWLGVD